MVGPWIILGLHHNLRDSKQSNEGDDQVDTTHEPIASKGKAGGAADIVHADGSHEQADASADQSLENTVVRDARNPTDSPKTAKAKYSAGPNSSVIFAIWGARNSRANALIRPPMVDAYSAICSALNACPLWVMG